MAFVRSPAVAGMFYPEAPDDLIRDIDEMFGRVRKRPKGGTVRGLISPHAGYMYSGFTAAHAYKALEGKNYEVVIVVGPSHRQYFEGISVFPGDAYRTPLGDILVSSSIRSEIVKNRRSIIVANAGHGSEHSVEVQLPFLQRILPDFSLVPVVMGDQRREFCEELADALASVAQNRNILLVASSDLSHYHPYDRAVSLDNTVVQNVEALDVDQLLDGLESEQIEACGGGPIAAVMLASRKLGANKSEVLYYCNSGDVTGDKGSVVGYMAAALLMVN